MNYASYKALCADPATQTEFLTALTEKLAPIAEDWKQREAIASVTVGGKPLSISMYLSALDMTSADWDHDGEDARAARFVEAAKRIVAVCPHLAVPDFVFGFTNLPGANVVVPTVRPKLDSGVSTHLLAPTVARAAASTPRERVAVCLEPETRRPQRLRTP